MAFQLNAFQRNAFQIGYRTGGDDTHDGFLDEIARKFWQRKHIKVAKKKIKPKKIIEQYEQIRKIEPELPKIDMSKLYELSKDKQALENFIIALDQAMIQLELYMKNKEDEDLLLMLCAIA